MTIDVGTGDGRAPLHLARTRTDTYAIGIEPSLDALRDTARALTRRPLPNVALLVATLEEAVCLGTIADEVTVTFPWGPLLDAALGDGDGPAAIAALLGPGASLRVLVSITDRDHRRMPDAGELRRSYADVGLAIRTLRPATVADVTAARSTWGKRLGAGRTRAATLIDAVRLSDAGRDGSVE